MEVHFDQTMKTPSSTRRQSVSSAALDDDDVFEGFSRGVSGLHEWTLWRTKLNSVMVDIIEERHRIFSYPNSKKHIKQHARILKTLTEPSFAIGKGVSEFALSRAVHDYVHGDDGFHLDAESFLSFGIPRVKLRSNMSYSADCDGETPTSPTSNRATDGSLDLDGDKTKELETGSDNIVYSEVIKRKSIQTSESSSVTDLNTSAPFIPTIELTETGVYL